MGKKLSDYEKYIRTEELLSLQKTEEQLCCEEERTFQMVHQIAELHFKLVIWYLQIARRHLEGGNIAEATTHVQRINLHMKHLPEVFHMVKVIHPIDYHTIRLSLGQGSGQDSPGFNQILSEAPTLWEPFAQLLQKANLPLLEIHQKPAAHPELFALMQALMQFDESFQSFRYHHLHIVKWMIGLETNSLKGVPAQALQKGVRYQFYPSLWEAISQLTDLTGSSYHAKPLDDER